MKIRGIGALIVWLAGQAVIAQNANKITLDQAIKLGLDHSTEIRISQAKLEQSKMQVSEARDQFLPNVGVSAMYLRVNTPNVSLDEGSGSGSGSGSSLSALSGLNSLGLAQLTASMPVFNGFKVKNNKIMADYFEQSATQDLESAKANTTLSIAKAVYQYYAVTESKKVVEINLKHAQQRVKEFKDLEAQGLLARNDLLKAELQANAIEVTLTEANNNLALAEYNLAIMLGLSEGDHIELDTAGMFNLTALNGWDSYLQQGMENRSELKSLSYQVKASEMGLKIAKAERLPSLSLSAGYANIFVPGVLTVTNALNAGVSLKYSLTAVIHANHKIREASARQEAVQASELAIQESIKKEIRKDYLACEQSFDKLALTTKAITQASENYDITERKYKQGLALLSDYLDAEAILLKAQIDHATTKADAMVAYYELEKSTGKLN